ncbi:MAG TPA: acyl-CoA dehydrogenase family protein [Streptosporangiaceae bacterium]|nr:acyl-CoA dehydrogenase family protein [Streptosporangiaceae bacterium]
MAIRDFLALSEKQRALPDRVRGFLADRLASGELHGGLDTQPGYSPELHACLTNEMGLAGLTIPEEFGGLGLSLADACVVHTELGRVLYPGPLVCNCLAAAALLAAGDREARQHWLPLVAHGSVTATVAAADEAGRWSSGPENVQAEPAIDGWRLSGRRWYVIAAHVADIVVVPATIESSTAMFLLKSGSSGLTVSRQLSLDLTRRISIVTLDETPALLLSRDTAAVASQAAAEQELLLATAAEAAGGIGWCLDASIASAEDREPADRRPGSFQAVANSFVDMLSDLRDVSEATGRAAVAAANGAGESIREARAVALKASESYRAAAEACIHLLGGTGVAREQEAYLHYRRAWSTQQLVGGPLADRAPEQQ